MSPKTKQEFLDSLGHLDRNELVNGAYEFLQLDLPRNTSKANAVIKIRHTHERQERERKKEELRKKQMAHSVVGGRMDPGEFYGMLPRKEARKFRKEFRKNGYAKLAAVPRKKPTQPLTAA